jgi:hypothetical protein
VQNINENEMLLEFNDQAQELNKWIMDLPQEMLKTGVTPGNKQSFGYPVPGNPN